MGARFASPDVRQARARLGRAVRYDDQEAAARYRADLFVAQFVADVDGLAERLTAAPPNLTDEQRARLSALLPSGG